MNIGKTLFAQLMDFLPWKTFHRIVDRCDGDRYVKTMTCADQFRVMAFAQLTYRESLRDIEVCLSAQSTKLYHMGLLQENKRSTLADVLVAIVKKRLNLDASLYTLLQIFSLTLFEKMPIQQAFAGSDYKLNHGDHGNQLNLFEF